MDGIDYITNYVDAKIESIKHLAAKLPDNVLIFKVGFPPFEDCTTICDTLIQMELMLERKLDRPVVTLPYVSENRDIQLIIPTNLTDDINKLEERVKRLESKRCVEAKGYCTHNPDTCPTEYRGESCSYFKKD